MNAPMNAPTNPAAREPESSLVPAQPTPVEEPEDADPTRPRRQGLSYEFRISGADPKSSFDFEDVADK